ncbi:MAG: hypothetical protein JO004_06580 [Methylobacteriaceae bacterium]|nr:hypothetical protein [Methylobacteriaceae bacterium]
MTEASHLWYARVDTAIRDLNQVLEDHRHLLIEQAALRAELRMALVKARVAHRPAAPTPSDIARPSRKPLRAAAATALVIGSASYAQAYDYVDSRGQRHWCLGANCPEHKSKAIDENNLAWEPPPGVKWQVVPEPKRSARAD